MMQQEQKISRRAAIVCAATMAAAVAASPPGLRVVCEAWWSKNGKGRTIVATAEHSTAAAGADWCASQLWLIPGNTFREIHVRCGEPDRPPASYGRWAGLVDELPGKLYELTQCDADGSIGVSMRTYPKTQDITEELPK